MSAQEDTISVSVRVRPLNDRERKQNARSILTIDAQDQQKLWIDVKSEQKPFFFDHLIDASVGQQEIFELVGKPQAEFCLKGYNASIFAYGQTGAGKTFTMLGKSGEARGLQPRVFEFIFGELTKFDNSRVKCSYLEIYNEQIIDLLSVTGSTLTVREDLKKGVYIEGLSEERVTSSEQAIELLNTGARNRHVSSTQMNFESSRSHSVFSLTIETKERDEASGAEKLKCSKFHFIDLAGSERQNLTAAVGQTLKEASNINKSLTVLGCVINSLVEQSAGKQRHIPYRDSKLTFILKDSLGGNSKTAIVAAVSDASISFQETLSTLKFAQRAKLIKNKAQLNEENSVSDAKALKQEIKMLREKIESMREHELQLEKAVKEAKTQEGTACGGGNSEDSADVAMMRDKIVQMAAECEQAEAVFEKHLKSVQSKHDNQINDYTQTVEQMKQELGKQFKYDLYHHIILNSQKLKIQGLLAKKGDTTVELASDIDEEKETDALLEEYHSQLNAENAGTGIDIEEPNSRVSKALTQLFGKVNSSIQSRQQLSELLTSIGNKSIREDVRKEGIKFFNKYQQNTKHPEKTRACEESIMSLRGEYESQLQQLQNQIRVVRTERQSALAEVSRHRSNLSSIQAELQAKTQEIKQMEEVYLEVCGQMSSENDSVSRARIIELEEKLIQVTEEKSFSDLERIRMQNIVRESSQSLQEMEQSHESMIETIDESEKKRAILLSEMKVQTEKISQLEDNQNASQQRVESLTQELENLIQSSGEMLEEASKSEEIAANNELLQQENQQLSDSLQKLTEQNDVLSSTNSFLQSQVDELNTKVEQLEYKQERTLEELNECERKLARLNEQHQDVLNDLESLRLNNTESSESLAEQSKSLYMRLDGYVTEIEVLTKEQSSHKLQMSRKQDQISKLQAKHNEILQSQKYFQTAHKEIQDKLQQATIKITKLKDKNKHKKTTLKDLTERLAQKESELVLIQNYLEEKTAKSNDLCHKLNELLDEKERLIEGEKDAQANTRIQEAQVRLLDANQQLQKEKLSATLKLAKVEAEKEELVLKHRGLEETFNNLIVQYSILKGEHSQLVISMKHGNSTISGKALAKVEAELYAKTEKILDLQNYLDKYAMQIRQLDTENIALKKDCDTMRKANTQSQTVIKECEKRIDSLVEVVAEFEMHCGIASTIVAGLTAEKNDAEAELYRLREALQSGPISINDKEYHRFRDSKMSKRLIKYSRKLQMAAASGEHHLHDITKGDDICAETMIGMLQDKLQEKEKQSKRYQEMAEELNAKLIQANKKIAAQMEHIQFQLKVYEEDKKHYRVDSDRTIKQLAAQSDEKTRQLALKQMRMNYFENLHAQIAEQMDKNNAIYAQNYQLLKDRDRKLSYSVKVQAEIQNQLSSVVNRKAFFAKNPDDSLRLALVKVLEFIETRASSSTSKDRNSSPTNNKENMNTVNSSSITAAATTAADQLRFKQQALEQSYQVGMAVQGLHSSSRKESSLPHLNSSSSSNYLKQQMNTQQLPQGILQPIQTINLPNGLKDKAQGSTVIQAQPHLHYTNLNVTSTVIAKEIEEFDRRLEKESKVLSTSQLTNFAFAQQSKISPVAEPTIPSTSVQQQQQNSNLSQMRISSVSSKQDYQNSSQEHRFTYPYNMHPSDTTTYLGGKTETPHQKRSKHKHTSRILDQADLLKKKLKAI